MHGVLGRNFQSFDVHGGHSNETVKTEVTCNSVCGLIKIYPQTPQTPVPHKKIEDFERDVKTYSTYQPKPKIIFNQVWQDQT